MLQPLWRMLGIKRCKCIVYWALCTRDMFSLQGLSPLPLWHPYHEPQKILLFSSVSCTFDVFIEWHVLSAFYSVDTPYLGCHFSSWNSGRAVTEFDIFWLPYDNSTAINDFKFTTGCLQIKTCFAFVAFWRNEHLNTSVLYKPTRRGQNSKTW